MWGPELTNGKYKHGTISPEETVKARKSFNLFCFDFQNFASAHFPREHTLEATLKTPLIHKRTNRCTSLIERVNFFMWLTFIFHRVQT